MKTACRRRDWPGFCTRADLGSGGGSARARPDAGLAGGGVSWASTKPCRRPWAVHRETWWRFRAVHRRLGFKFWAFVSGGATLPADLESFWTTIGFALIQGYGMTETTALVTLNHPFKIARGSIGKPLAGREVQIGADGEILVRGDSIASQVWQHGGLQAREPGWLATGDLAARNEQGELIFAGRKAT